MLRRLYWTGFVHFFTLCLLGECYQVTITSNPPSPIPFNYGNVNLTCHVSPMPPAPVYYTWTSIYQFWSTPTYVNNTPIATLYVYYHEAPRFPVFYCHVHSGNMLITSGKITLQLEGFLSYGESLPMEYTVGTNITLKVEIIDHYLSDHIQSLGWFYNNTPICVCSCNSHYTLSNDSKNLTIVNASTNDVGTYEARVSSYQIYGFNDEMCDRVTNELLAYQAVFAPVAYNLSYTIFEGKLSLSPATFTPQHNNIFAKINESLLYNKYYEKFESSIDSAIYVYYNGYLNQTLLSSNGSFSGTNDVQLLVNISNYQGDEDGEYIVIMYTQSEILDDEYACFPYYYFVAGYLNFYELIWNVEVLQILTTVSPKVVVVANELPLKIGEPTTLNCTVSNGIPGSHVSWIKNGQYLSNVTTVTTPVHQMLNDECTILFGEYICVVSNEFYTSLHSILIQEKVSMQSLWTMNIKQWQSLDLMDQDMVKDVITEELKWTMDTLCKQCGITHDHFINSSFEVVDNAMYSVMGIYYTSYIVYSSPEGDVTASTLVALLQQWLLEEEDNKMQVTVDEAPLTLYKPCSIDKNSPTSKTLCLTSLSTALQAAWNILYNTHSATSTPYPVESFLNNPQNQTSSVIAGTFIGGMLAGALCTLITALAIVLVYKKFSSHCASNSQTEIEMKDNAAYEEVNVGVESCPQPHPPRIAYQQQEDNIYDL